MNNQIKRLLIIAALPIVAVSCKSYYETLLKSDDPSVKYEGAFNYYNKGKFKKASELFESLMLAMQGTPQEDTVQFYTALSNYKFGDYSTAESGFDKFVQVFPRSPFTEEAKYLRIKCLYEGTYRYELDPSPTRRAISIINEFMYENPDSPYYSVCKKYTEELMDRLYKKSYEAAKLYYKMEDYKAAHYALKNVLKENSENTYREDILYYTAMSAYKFAQNSIPSKQKERYLVFADDYYNFAGEFPESEYKKELDDLYAKVEKIIKKEKDNTTTSN